MSETFEFINSVGLEEVPSEATTNQITAKSDEDVLVVAVHYLMVETGYHPEIQQKELLEGVQVSQNTYKICYTVPNHGDAAATIACVFMHPNLIIHGMNNVSRGVTLTLNINDYVGDDRQLKNYQQLSMLFKDNISQNMLLQMKMETDSSYCPPLLALPVEIMLRILKLCDFKTVLTACRACKYLNNLCMDKELWCSLYQQRFGKVEEPGETNWYEKYKTSHKDWLREERLKLEQAARARSESHFIRLHFRPHRHLPPRPLPPLAVVDFDGDEFYYDEYSSRLQRNSQSRRYHEAFPRLGRFII